MDYSKLSFALYARKSTEDSGKQVQSIPDQIKWMRDRAYTLDIKVKRTAIFQESKSAKAPSVRPEFNRLIKDIKDGKYNAVLAWSTSRIARNPQEAGIIQQLLQDGVLKCIITNEKAYYPEDNAVVFAVEMGINSQFIRDLMRNVRRGMYSKAERGWFPGAPPIGYKNDRETKTIIADIERYALVRKMWDLMLTGSYTVAEITRKADKEWGLRTMPRKKIGGKPLSMGGVYAMFQNRFYAGWVIYGNVENPKGLHPAMVTQDEFEKVQSLIKRRNNPRVNVEQEIDPFPYRGVVHCGECGCAITYSRKTKHYKSGKSQDFEYCYCTDRKKDYRCTQKYSVKPQELTKRIREEIEKYTIMDEFFQYACKYLGEYNDSEADKQEAIYANQTRSIASIENELRELGRMRYRGQIGDDFYETEKKELEQKLKVLRKKFNEQEDQNELWRVKADKFFNFARYAKEDFESDDDEKKREVLATIGQNLVLLDGQLRFEPIKYLQPVLNTKKSFETQLAQVGTQPERIRKAAYAALISDWYAR